MTSFLLGDPPKRVVKRLVRSMPGHSVRCDYLAYYDMDHSNPEQRAAFWRRSSEHLRLGETVRRARCAEIVADRRAGKSSADNLKLG